ncbi:SPOR domain-containing protein [Acidovorax sp. sif1233]|uniref:SPOR domain-containing protein n=1 Tax=unclassified Acidovorax TaxID=2684926 RepID=UPI001C47F97A|nr:MULTISPECIES: SPOR domain-containing protein [unclassified Acidovorax]MBV7430700.1 SPOR domain-containing protein [Acidovorax sp. sif0732]MBV7449124.1 SPOR domain-containing protein [Acidovorax sp. sif0715]MBV7457081.1 SPOR domain-containing protein [Acidovorax sp. sif1233]
MLRLAVIALLLANAGYYAWSQGLLRDWGFAPEEQAEPQRMDQQIRPETLQILRVNSGKAPAAASPAAPSAAAAASAETPTPPDTGECLQAGVFDERQADALRAAAANLPQGSWLLEPTPVPGRWMVYMGRFEDLETLDRKRAELRARKVDHDRAGGTLEFGLSLGRFASKEAAERELATLGGKGVRTARVVQERPDTAGFTLRLPAVTESLRPQLDALRTAMAGKTMRACG